ncbi:hypothetical protein N752_17475 [Desulforamulus aquiferis]|nr:hypothetical protein [Desulforamulus aquiferis]RYD03872.1 hypothetical protein N752_17475 [Desulforamulus aquiferis]
MNGMPHGSGAIRGNDFRGHFCIHFRDSKVHQSGKENLAHQMMIWKSAGKFREMVATMRPEEVIEVFFTAIDQQSVDLAIKTLDNPSNKEMDFLKLLDSEIERIKVQRIRQSGGNFSNYLTYLTLRYRDDSKDVEKRIELRMNETPDEGWKLQGDGLEQLMDRKASVEVLLEGTFDDDDHCD